MQKQISIKAEEGAISLFDDIHRELSFATRGQTFEQIVNNYRISKETLINTEKISEDFQKKSEDFQKISEDFHQLSEDFQRISEENRVMREELERISDKDLEINRISEDLQKKSEDFQRISEEIQDREKKRYRVQPEWEAIATRVVEKNALASIDAMMWHLFSKWVNGDIDPGLRRIGNREMEEIISEKI